MEPLPEELEERAPAVRKLRLPHVPKKEPAVPEPRRPFLIRVLRSPLQLTLGVLALSPAVFIAEASKWEFAAVIKLVFLIVVIGLIFFYIGLAAFTASSEWFKTQKRISELMATIFFGASVMTVLMSRAVKKEEALVGCFVLSFGWAAIGSTWAWDRMRILGETRQRARLWMLAKGWMAVPGVIGAVFFMFATVVLILSQIGSRMFSPEELRVWLIWYGTSLCAAMALWPAISVEMQLRTRAKAKK